VTRKKVARNGSAAVGDLILRLRVFQELAVESVKLAGLLRRLGHSIE
jgi:hypothetical protein